MNKVGAWKGHNPADGRRKAGARERPGCGGGWGGGKGAGIYMMPLELEALLGCHVVLLQQLPLLSKQWVAVGDGRRDCHFVVGILLVHYAIVQQETAVGLRPTPRKNRLTCSRLHKLGFCFLRKTLL